MPYNRLFLLSFLTAFSISGFSHAANEGGNDGAMDGAAANNGMDIPVFTAVSLNGDDLSVAGYVGTAANKIAGSHRIEIFAVGANADPSGFGEVSEYIGTCDGTNGSNPDGTFECTVDSSGLSTALNLGDKISATATYDPSASDGYQGSTSEYSYNETVRDCVVVTRTADSGHGTLRSAITCANADNIDSVISFDIPTSEPGHAAGVWTIALASALPSLTEANTTIDASTQTGATCGVSVDANDVLTDRNLNVVLDGTSSSSDGLVADGKGYVIKGLVINNFTGRGIKVNSASGDGTIVCNHVGVDVTGNAKAGNVSGGISMANGNNTTIGDGTASGRNVIGGNHRDGISVGTTPATGFSLNNNYIGVGLDGVSDVGNQDPNNLTGWYSGMSGYTDFTNILIRKNVIGFQPGPGIQLIQNSVTNVEVVSNIFGLGADGVTPAPTELNNMKINEGTGTATNVVIGRPGEGNLFASSNRTAFSIGMQGSNITVQANKFGTDISGTLARGINTGLSLAGSASGNLDNILVGGTGAGEGNLISGNVGNGAIFSNTTNMQVLGNIVGMDVNGVNSLPNGNKGGLYFFNDQTGSTVGNGTAAGRNIISGNLSAGIALRRVSNLTIDDNYIGVAADGTSLSGNGSNGIVIFKNTDLLPTDNITIQNNIIADSKTASPTPPEADGLGAGIYIDDYTTNVTLLGNEIYGHAADGIMLHQVDAGGVTDISIGNGTAAGANTIRDNAHAGVSINAAAKRIKLQRNLIYSNGELGIDLVGAGVDKDGNAE